MKTIQAGTRAPDFELPDETGKPVHLAELLADGPVVLFFYPTAMSGGCTAEVCHFRDLAAEFAAAGARPVGISTDSMTKQHEFSRSTGIDFPLVSDQQGDVARAYGVKRKYVTPVKRATFVIDTDGVIREVIASEWSMNVHADKALEALAELAAH
jgi:peroxiredoxin Q/BCP